MRRYFGGGILLLAVATGAFAHDGKAGHRHDKAAEESSDDAQFKLDPGLVDRIYRESEKSEASNGASKTLAMSFSAQASMLSFDALKLENAYFKNDYSSTIGSVPMANVSMLLPGYTLGGFVLRGEFAIGYGYREALLPVVTVSGAAFRDLVRVHWVPISASARLEYPLPFASWITPSLKAGGGIQWVSQGGRIDGLGQNFWIPFVAVSPSVKLFDQRGSNGWFGGLSLGATVLRSVGSVQQVQYWSVDGGVEVVL